MDGYALVATFNSGRSIDGRGGGTFVNLADTPSQANVRPPTAGSFDVLLEAPPQLPWAASPHVP